MNEIKILSGHVSPETAYVVDDYPYGFVLRCKIRYWLESSPKKGSRLVSQTTNPKRGHAWNKPKASTYQRFGGAMYLDARGHVTWSGCNEYCELQELIDWQTTFSAGVPEEMRPVMLNWIARKTAFNDAKAAGKVAIVTTCNGVETNRTVLAPEILRMPGLPPEVLQAAGEASTLTTP